MVTDFFGFRVFRQSQRRHTGDGVQRPLRSGFQARLMPGVDMTSNVKSWVKILVRLSSLCCPLMVTLAIGRAGARNMRRLITLIAVGWVPPSLRPSGACLYLGPRVSFSL
jgi:hypothetical protein